ncbi:MAG: hypothetical protein FJ304_13545 [Planctomycetes bacterium]|nr:hypothetical protein [Planctomycetota bacterium]
MRRAAFPLVPLLAVGIACRPATTGAPVEEAQPAPAPAGTLKARVVSWDVGYHPATEAAWVDRVVSEVTAANRDGVNVLLFPELFAAGLGEYAPTGTRPYEFITRRMTAAVLPAVKDAAGPAMLVCLGSYAHQEAGWPDALNRAPLLLDGVWHFADKVHPTQGELVDDPPIKPGAVVPVFRFRGGNVAVAVCFTLQMPDVFAALKKDGGIQLVLGPTATADGDGVARILRTASARAVELGAAVLVAPLLGKLDDWSNTGRAALYLPANKGIDHAPRESALRTAGIARDDFVIPWEAILALRKQPAGRPETRAYLTEQPFRVERK